MSSSGFPDWGSLLQGFQQDPLGSLGGGLQAGAQYAMNPGYGLGSAYSQGLGSVAAGLQNFGQNLMPGGPPPQAQYGQPAQPPPQQPYNYGTSAGPNAYGYGSAPSAGAAGAGAGTAGAGTAAGGAATGGPPRPVAPGQTPGGFGPTGQTIPTPGQAGGVQANMNPAGAAFDDPTTAVWSVLKNLGINVNSSDPRITQLLGKAQDIVFQNLLPLVSNGTLNNLDPNAIAQALTGVVQKYLTNQPVFYGPTGGAGILQSLLTAGQGGEQTSSPQGLQYLASILDNPTAAAALGNSLLFGGAVPQAAANILSKGIRTAPAAYALANFNAPGGLPVPGATGYASLLQRYLAGEFGNMQQQAPQPAGSVPGTY